MDRFIWYRERNIGISFDRGNSKNSKSSLCYNQNNRELEFGYSFGFTVCRANERRVSDKRKSVGVFTVFRFKYSGWYRTGLLLCVEMHWAVIFAESKNDTSTTGRNVTKKRLSPWSFKERLFLYGAPFRWKNDNWQFMSPVLSIPYYLQKIFPQCLWSACP